MTNAATELNAIRTATRAKNLELRNRMKAFHKVDFNAHSGVTSEWFGDKGAAQRALDFIPERRRCACTLHEPLETSSAPDNIWRIDYI